MRARNYIHDVDNVRPDYKPLIEYTPSQRIKAGILALLLGAGSILATGGCTDGKKIMTPTSPNTGQSISDVSNTSAQNTPPKEQTQTKYVDNKGATSSSGSNVGGVEVVSNSKLKWVSDETVFEGKNSSLLWKKFGYIPENLRGIGSDYKLVVSRHPGTVGCDHYYLYVFSKKANHWVRVENPRWIPLE